MGFYMPVRIYDEPDCVAAHAEQLASCGKKALLVTGRHSAKRCGALDAAAAALSRFGRDYSVFPEIEENPSIETVTRAAVFGLMEGADFVIGIGGGSPLDAAKAVALLMRSDEFTAAARQGRGSEEAQCAAQDSAVDSHALFALSSGLLYDNGAPSAHLPVIAIPTTCGTGSEVTGVSVLTIHAKRTKGSIPHRIFPELALLDGKYLRSAPLSMLASTAVDAFAHMAESFESVKSDDYSRAAVLRGLALWGRAKEILTGAREASDEDLTDLLRASTFGGIAIAQTGTSVPHALSYILTYDLGMPHGRAAGYFLPSYLREADEADRAMLLGAAGFSGLEDFTSFMAAAFPDAAVPGATLQRAYDVVSGNTARLKGCRFPVDGEVLRRIVFHV